MVIIFIELVILLQSSHQKISSSQITRLLQETIQKYAEEILIKCSSTTHHQSCYDEAIPKLMDPPTSISMEDAFEVTRIVQQKDPTFPYCHVLGHNLSAKEVQKDPNNWKSVVSRCPSGMCSNGCIHGGFQEKFRAESLTDEQIEGIKPDLKNICEERSNWHPTGLEQASCYHALGHLTMYLTDANIDKSITLCEEIAIKDGGRNFTQVCFDGVFMQIYQPLEPEDFALVKGKQPAKDEVLTFCSKYESQERNSCMSESWPLYRTEILDNPQGLVDFCSRFNLADQPRCYMALFYVITAQFNFNSEKIETYCNGLPNNWQGSCFANSASRLIETDYGNMTKSVVLCSSAKSDDVRDICFDELVKYSTFNFHAGSEPFFKFCNGLPEPWKTSCLTKV